MDILEMLRECGYKPVDHGKYYRMAALFRGGKNPNSLAVNKADGRFIDFAGGGQRGSFEDLLKLMMGDEETIQKYISAVEFDVNECATSVSEQIVVKTFPKSILKNLVPHWDRYLEMGISEQTMRDFEVGMGQTSKMNRRYVFPIYNLKNEIIGFAGRWYEDVPFSDNVPKWKLLGRKAKWVYPNHLYIVPPKQVILVEGIGCLLRLYENGHRGTFPVFGKDLSTELLKYLIMICPDEIILSLNNEPDNKNIGLESAKKIRTKLLQFFMPERIRIVLPWKKDFGVMTNEETKQWLKALDEKPQT